MWNLSDNKLIIAYVKSSPRKKAALIFIGGGKVEQTCSFSLFHIAQNCHVLSSERIFRYFNSEKKLEF